MESVSVSCLPHDERKQSAWLGHLIAHPACVKAHERSSDRQLACQQAAHYTSLPTGSGYA